MRTVYLVLAVIPWGTDSEEDAESRFNMPDSSGQGFCAVFESFEDAKREWPGEDIMQVRIDGKRLDHFGGAEA